jgi:oxygen-independent coproporphyrinogen-3 oxidase
MKYIENLKALGLFDARVPRYTSYPTAKVFSPQIGADFQKTALENLDPKDPVSVYIHIPFCERLCWFCACHTQGTKTLNPVESYIESLEKELDLIRKTVPPGLHMGRVHWGGGTPTILSPPLIHRLAQAIRGVFPQEKNFDFSVEIDPTMVDQSKITALACEGMTRASIGIQDFDAEVQAAIGRAQPFEVTRTCVEDLRAVGISSLNADLIYGLPHQTRARIEDTIDKVLTFAPERVAIFGYAHVPWVSKRQKLIDEDTLPDDLTRYTLATLAGRRFIDSGFAAIGIDHFARPGDDLETALRTGQLRRNFQGYTADTCRTLIGIGASSISRFPGGYVQNAPATAVYQKCIFTRNFPGSRGYKLTVEDQLRARAIEQLMCEFTLDLDALTIDFGSQVAALAPLLTDMAKHFARYVKFDGTQLQIVPEGRPLTRIIASFLDQHVPEGARYSRVS